MVENEHLLMREYIETDARRGLLDIARLVFGGDSKVEVRVCLSETGIRAEFWARGDRRVEDALLSMYRGDCTDDMYAALVGLCRRVRSDYPAVACPSLDEALRMAGG